MEMITVEGVPLVRDRLRDRRRADRVLLSQSVVTEPVECVRCAAQGHHVASVEVIKGEALCRDCRVYVLSLITAKPPEGQPRPGQGTLPAGFTQIFAGITSRHGPGVSFPPLSGAATISKELYLRMGKPGWLIVSGNPTTKQLLLSAATEREPGAVAVSAARLISQRVTRWAKDHGATAGFHDAVQVDGDSGRWIVQF